MIMNDDNIFIIIISEFNIYTDTREFYSNALSDFS
jgi:hypothetical protein